MDSSILFTSAALVDLLSQIEELQDLEINITETDSALAIKIGDSLYNVQDSAEEVSAPDYVVADIEDITDDAYEQLQSTDRFDVDSTTNINGGIIKELAKTILVGGLVRLTSKLLRK